MTLTTQRPKVKKANFLFQIQILEKLANFVPEGERSQFVNRAVDQALVDFGRRKAVEFMDQFSKEIKWKMTEEEVRKAREYGRE